MSKVAPILCALEQGQGHDAGRLSPLVYDELRKLAAEKLSRESPGQTLQATALVHEAYLRLVAVEQVQHFPAAATSSPPRRRPCGESW